MLTTTVAYESRYEKIKIFGDCEFFMAVTLFFPFFITFFNNTIRFFISNTYKLDTLFLYGVYAFLCLLCMKEILHRIRTWQILFAVFTLSILFVSALFSSRQSDNLAVIQTVLLSCFPVFFLSGAVRDFSALKKYIDKFALIAPYLLAFTVYILKADTLNGDSYSQYMSYFLLLPTVVLLDSVLSRFQIRTLISCLLSFFLMLSYGARGPLACVILFAVIKLLLAASTVSKSKKLMFAAALFLAGILLYFSYYPLLHWLLRIFEHLGFSTRTLERLLDRSFLADSSRSKIYAVCLSRILSHPLLGTGAVNDRLMITKMIPTLGDALGNYPHNFFLEILMQYGVLCGGAILAYFLFQLITSLKEADRDQRSVLLIMVTVGFLPLLFSGSYIESWYFYILLGLCGNVKQLVSKAKPLKGNCL